MQRSCSLQIFNFILTTNSITLQEQILSFSILQIKLTEGGLLVQSHNSTLLFVFNIQIPDRHDVENLSKSVIWNMENWVGLRCQTYKNSSMTNWNKSLLSWLQLIKAVSKRSPEAVKKRKWQTEIQWGIYDDT